MSKRAKSEVNQIRDESSTISLFPEAEVTPTPDVTQADEKPSLETTTLWDYPKQSYGKTPRATTNFRELHQHSLFGTLFKDTRSRAIWL